MNVVVVGADVAVDDADDTDVAAVDSEGVGVVSVTPKWPHKNYRL